MRSERSDLDVPRVVRRLRAFPRLPEQPYGIQGKTQAYARYEVIIVCTRLKTYSHEAFNLNALPVHLQRQVFFLSFAGVFPLKMVPEGS